MEWKLNDGWDGTCIIKKWRTVYNSCICLYIRMEMGIGDLAGLKNGLTLLF